MNLSTDLFIRLREKPLLVSHLLKLPPEIRRVIYEFYRGQERIDDFTNWNKHRSKFYRYIKPELKLVSGTLADWFRSACVTPGKCSHCDAVRVRAVGRSKLRPYWVYRSEPISN